MIFATISSGLEDRFSKINLFLVVHMVQQVQGNIGEENPEGGRHIVLRNLNRMVSMVSSAAM